jgi:hypothetical protein
MFLPGIARSLPSVRSGVGSLSRVRVELTEDSLEVRLAAWEKALGLMKDIELPLRDIDEVRVVEKPMREVRGSGLKAGLRLPGVRYIARTIRLDQVFVLKRGEQAVTFTVRNHDPLQSVMVSVPDAPRLAKRLRGKGR